MGESLYAASIAEVAAGIDIFTFLLSTMVLLMALILRRLNRHLAMAKERMLETDRQLNHVLHRINRLEECQMRGSATLDLPRAEAPKDELVTRLQTAPLSGDTPSRYRHVASLAQQGMDAEQIAEILNISVAEASQLMSLSRLAPVKHEQ